jgi:murein DD-endopeptidase MepM/ murein hydrolase activator NlpD
MPRGRHARPSPVPRYARNAGAGGLATLAVMMNQQSVANAAPDDVWAPVIDCESGGDPTAQNPTSTASGLYQIIDGTWAAYGGTEFAPRAKQATPEQQRIVAERILHEGYNGHAPQGPGAWGPCSDSLQDWVAAGSPQGGPAPTPPPPPPAPPAPDPVDTADTDVIPVVNEYRVASGDTMRSIAERVGMDMWALADLNGISDPDVIYVDQILQLAPPEQEIVVKEGDWLSTIAQDLGICTPEDDIATCWEPLYEQNVDVVGPNPDTIHPGQVLHFVGGLPLPVAPVAVPDPPPAPAPAPAPAPTVNPSGYAFPLPGGYSVGDGLGAGRSHDGQDLAIALGTPVFAAHDGYVGRADWMGDDDGVGSAPDNGGYGNLVEVTAADGTMTRYTHLDTVEVGDGVYVAAGDLIGTVGSTGHSTGAHLHFEVHLPSGSVAEPLVWLTERGVY